MADEESFEEEAEVEEEEPREPKKKQRPAFEPQTTPSLSQSRTGLFPTLDEALKKSGEQSSLGAWRNRVSKEREESREPALADRSPKISDSLQSRKIGERSSLYSAPRSRFLRPPR